MNNTDNNIDEYSISYEDISTDVVSGCFLTVSALGNRNPGAFKVASELTKYLKNMSEPSSRKNIIQFILKLLDKNITDSRLWYIYKNEAERNINNLLKLNLDCFTDDYFYEAYEQYL